MNKLLKYGIPAILSAAALTACDDWTDTEAVDLNYPTVEETSPELYARYLENLRAYKGRSHKQIYAWFRNNATPDNRSTHVTVLPDSIDAVVVLNPQSVADFVYADMAETREKKATKFLYTVDFDAIKSAYNLMVESAAAEEPVTTAFRDFLVDSMQTALSYAKHYDGLCIAYTGKPRKGMKPAELADYEANERLFTGVLADWHRRHEAKRIDFVGNPQNLADKTLLEECNMIFLSASLDVTESYAFNTVLSDARAEGVPLDRLGMIAATTSLDKDDTKTGILNDGTPSLTALAAWAPYAEVGGVGIYNVERDYFNPAFVFPRTRTLIHSVNPNVK